MKFIKYLFPILSGILLLIALGLFLYLRSLQPKYSGQIELENQEDEVTVHFDYYGIPHIYAQHETDAFRILGYLHAQERLFQMEMIRRVASGRLSEILGEEMLATDQFFRTLGIKAIAEASVAEMMQEADSTYVKSALAYFDGVNQFVRVGKTPIEFQLIGIPKDTFNLVDAYLIAGFMSFGFAEGFKIDPLLTQIKTKLGDQYLKDWALEYVDGTAKIPISGSNMASNLALHHHKIIESLPTSTWIGSNGWVIGAKKTESGAVILENDTHMAHAAPGVWYEAHIETPNWGFYGNYVAGFPFAMVGHTRFGGWGLTMFENDDVDFYVEKANPDDSTQVWINDQWEPLSYRQETIQIKGKKAHQLWIRTSSHGPIISDIHQDIPFANEHPVSVWWAFTKQTNHDLKAVYGLSHAQSLSEARLYVSYIDAPGLNVMYGNTNGDIAWWATARLKKRPAHVKSKFFLDGSSGQDEALGFYDFMENPMNENPTQHYVYSANNQPDTMAGILYPGYYVPENRAKRITQLLEQEQQWNVDKVKAMAFDDFAEIDLTLCKELLQLIASNRDQLDHHQRKVFDSLAKWDGKYDLKSVGASIFTTWLATVLEMAMADELGELYSAFLSTHEMKNSIAPFLRNDSSVWWNNIRSTDTIETRTVIVFDAFKEAVKILSDEYDPNISKWTWGRTHTIEYQHPIGSKEPMDLIFNRGPFPISGGNEVINNQGFKLYSRGKHTVNFGPAMRRVIDFSDPENSYSILPLGQSGYFMSRHYDDQAKLYLNGQYRKQLMNKAEIEANALSTLLVQIKAK